jgi:hypothetical protein
MQVRFEEECFQSRLSDPMRFRRYWRNVGKNKAVDHKDGRDGSRGSQE